MSTSGYAKESQEKTTEEKADWAFAISTTDDPVRQTAIYWKLRALSEKRRADTLSKRVTDLQKSKDRTTIKIVVAVAGSVILTAGIIFGSAKAWDWVDR